ncbi:MAG: N-(5'-phosphoribosyl)anthranilate isomerase [Pseudomonadota bacterium]
MQMISNHMSAEHWLRQVFSAKAAVEGGVVRRKVADVHRIVGCLAFEAEVRRRGFRAVQNGRDYVVFCNSESLRLIE